MKLVLTIILTLTILLLGGCVTAARSPREILSAVKIDMPKSQVYNLVDVQYFRGNESFLGATISDAVYSRGKIREIVIGNYYDRPYYGYFFFDPVTDSKVTLVMFGWDSDLVVATGTVPFARAQEIAEEKYGQPFRR